MIENNYNSLKNINKTENNKIKLKDKDQIIYNLQLKNTELEIIINKQYNLINNLENQIKVLKNKLNKEINLKEIEFKNKWKIYKLNYMKFYKKIEINKNLINDYKIKNNKLKNDNFKFTNYIKELEYIINNNNSRIKELQEIVKNFEYFNDNNNIVKDELIENYNCLKEVDNNYYNLITILNKI